MLEWRETSPRERERKKAYPRSRTRGLSERTSRASVPRLEFRFAKNYASCRNRDFFDDARPFIWSFDANTNVTPIPSWMERMALYEESWNLPRILARFRARVCRLFLCRLMSTTKPHSSRSRERAVWKLRSSHGDENIGSHDDGMSWVLRLNCNFRSRKISGSAIPANRVGEAETARPRGTYLFFFFFPALPRRVRADPTRARGHFVPGFRCCGSSHAWHAGREWGMQKRSAIHDTPGDTTTMTMTMSMTTFGAIALTVLSRARARA